MKAKAKIKWRRRQGQYGFSFSWPDLGLSGEVSIGSDFDAESRMYWEWNIDVDDTTEESTNIQLGAHFRTDPRVIAIVDRVCDARIGDRFAEDRRERAFAIAWNRDEGGLRTEAIERAHAMCEVGE